MKIDATPLSTASFIDSSAGSHGFSLKLTQEYFFHYWAIAAHVLINIGN